jgi:hypothetical protein
LRGDLSGQDRCGPALGTEDGSASGTSPLGILASGPRIEIQLKDARGLSIPPLDFEYPPGFDNVQPAFDCGDGS